MPCGVTALRTCTGSNAATSPARRGEKQVPALLVGSVIQRYGRGGHMPRVEGCQGFRRGELKLLWEARAQASGEPGNRPSFAVSPPVAGGEVTIPSSQSSDPSITAAAGKTAAATHRARACTHRDPVWLCPAPSVSHPSPVRDGELWARANHIGLALG